MQVIITLTAFSVSTLSLHLSSWSRTLAPINSDQLAETPPRPLLAPRPVTFTHWQTLTDWREVLLPLQPSCCHRQLSFTELSAATVTGSLSGGGGWGGGLLCFHPPHNTPLSAPPLPRVLNLHHEAQAHWNYVFFTLRSSTFSRL